MKRICENCRHPIPETTRIDAIFCSPKCGWTYRNRIKREERLKALNTMLQNPTGKNYGIIEFLHENNQTSVTRDELMDLGFDPEVHYSSRIIQHKPFVMEFSIKDFVLTHWTKDIITIEKRVL